MLDVVLTFDKSQKSHFLELSVKQNWAIKFGILIIWDVMITLGSFLKSYICIKEHKDRKVTFCDITILSSQTVLHSML